MRSSTLKYVSIITAEVLLLSGSLILFHHIKYHNFYEYGRRISLTPSQMRSFYGKPDRNKDRLLEICLEAPEGNWDKILELTQSDTRSELISYFRNLALAMTGHLADSLMYHYQPFERGLFLPVRKGADPFEVAQSGEVWYRLGALTMAEHSTMLAMTFSRNKTGRKFLERLRDINFINGDTAAAEKYAKLLGQEPRWTRDKQEIKSYLANSDTIHFASDARTVLRTLLKANDGNRPAYGYLLCYDLLIKDLDAFVKDYNHDMPHSRLYEEAALIYLTSTGSLNEESAEYFRISEDTYRQFGEYSRLFSRGEGKIARLQPQFGNTYWFYYNFAKRNEKE